MLLPLQPVLDVEFLEQVHHVGVRAEEDVKAGLDPIPVLVLPRRYLAAEHVPALEHDGNVTRICEVLCAREPSQTATDDHHPLGLVARTDRRDVTGELRGQRLGLLVVGVARLVQVGRREVARDDGTKAVVPFLITMR